MRLFPRPSRALALATLIAGSPVAIAAQTGAPPVGEHAGPRRLHLGVAVEERLAHGADALAALAANRPDGALAAELAEASAVAVIPEVRKTDVGMAGHHGAGMAVRRTWRDGWGDPLFVELSGAVFEPPVGPDATELVLVFGEPAEIVAMLQDDAPVGTDASTTGEPLGRRTDTAANLTDATAVRCYARTEDGWLNVALTAARLSPDPVANHRVYGPATSPRTITSGEPEAPPAVESFTARVRDLVSTRTR